MNHHGISVVHSRRKVLQVGAALLASTVLRRPAYAAPLSSSAVGDPREPAALPAAILSAYEVGERDITINPGTYVLPDTGSNSIELNDWSDATIHCKDVTLIFEGWRHRPIQLKGCSNVTLQDATLQFAVLSYTQGRIKAIGTDTKGRYVDWQIDAGYPTNIDPEKASYNVLDQHTRLLKVGTGDSESKQVESLGVGFFRLRQIDGLMGGAAVNDWLVCRAPGGESIIELNNSKNCTLRRITLKNSGFAAFFEQGGEGGHHYVDCRVTRGARPSGAKEDQLIACGADGFHSVGATVGPTIERCTWDGVLLDDCIAIHGGFSKVLRAEGNKLVVESHRRMGFAVGEPVRVSSTDGFFAQANCIALRELDAPTGQLELTLDRAIGAPVDSKADNPERCGKNYKIVGCTLGNTRSRGILVKADGGLIQDCVIEGCGMSAISIGPEYYWNEADYSWNVKVVGNKIRRNALRNNAIDSPSNISQQADGVIFVHGDGAIGNRNIQISGNTLDENYSPFMMNIGWADGVRIENNIVNSPGPLPLTSPGYIVDFHNCRNVILKGNTYSRPGPSFVEAIHIGADVEGVAGNDESGMRRIDT